MKRKSILLLLILLSILLVTLLVFFFLEEEKSLSDLISVSISSSSSDIRQNYSFFLYKEDESWLLNAYYFTPDTEEEINIEKRELDEAKVKKLFEILDCDNNKKKGRKRWSISSLFFIPDRETYSFVLTFQDKSQYIEKVRKQKIEEFFYSSAEK